MDINVRPFGHYLGHIVTATPRKWNGTFLARVGLRYHSLVLNWLEPELRGWRRAGSRRFRVYDFGAIRLMVGDHRP